MKRAFGPVLWLTWWAACGVLVRLVANAVTGQPATLWSAALSGLGLGIGTALMLVAFNKGWISGVFRDPKKVRELNERRDQLAQERADMLAGATRK